MWELTEDNVLDYLREKGVLTASLAQAETLSGGVSNIVLRVEQGERRLVVKQSRPQLRTKEAWFSDIDRIWREQEVMEVLCPLLAPGVIPQLVFVDRERYLFAMDHAPLPARSWKECLLKGEVDISLGLFAGRLLGDIHEVTGRNPAGIARFTDHTVFIQLRVDPFYRKIQHRHPDLHEAVESLVQELLTRKQALCHGDFSPKNLLVHPGGLVLVDHETAHLGEPAMDIGFFFSHLLLKSIHAMPNHARYRELIMAAWAGYEARVRFESAERLLHRGLGHMGLCLLARMDGTSPVDYLKDEPKRDIARRLGRWILQERPHTWETIWQRLDTERL